MSNLSPRHVKWFALLLTLVLITVTYLFSESRKVQLNTQALKMFTSLPAAVRVIKSMPEYVALFQEAFPKDNARLPTTTWNWRLEPSSLDW